LGLVALRRKVNVRSVGPPLTATGRGISKRGNGYLQMLLIHGARTALPGLANKDTPLGRRVKALLARAHRNVVTVALANKLARIAWAVFARDRRYVAVQLRAVE
jgi:hypothetical protein